MPDQTPNLTPWERLMSGLKPFPTEGLKPFPMEGLQTLAGTPTPKTARMPAAGLDQHQRHARRPTRRRTFDGRHLARIAQALPGLPAEGESWHLVLKGNSPLFLMLPRILELAAPATIASLHISTLGFSLAFAEMLLAMLDAGQVGKVSLAVSTYFHATSQGEFKALADGLAERRQTLKVCRTHGKVLALMMTNGTGYALEGSGNLRSCRMVEQVVISRDAELVQFHARWIDQLLQEAA